MTKNNIEVDVKSKMHITGEYTGGSWLKGLIPLRPMVIV